MELASLASNSVALVVSLLAFIIAFVTMHLLHRGSAEPLRPGRYTSLDGLRGVLALFVFLHHSAVWYTFLHSNEYDARGTSGMLMSAAACSVGAFFMITALLFTGKILNSKGSVDWIHLYVSRILRIVPLFYCVVGLMLVNVAICTHFHLNVNPIKQFAWLGEWLLFVKYPVLNGYDATTVIVGGGIYWTLTYEWFFYFSLPILALLLRCKPSAGWLAASLLMMVVWIGGVWHFKVAAPMAWFSGGFVAVACTRSDRIRQLARTPAATILVFCCVCILAAAPPMWADLVCVSLPVSIIACGNSLFGLLTHPTMRRLGDVSYGTYLLNGLVVFTVFRYIVGYRIGAQLSPMAHWGVILAATPLLVIVANAAHHRIELPALAHVARVTARIKRSPAI